MILVGGSCELWSSPGVGTAPAASSDFLHRETSAIGQ